MVAASIERNHYSRSVPSGKSHYFDHRSRSRRVFYPRKPIHRKMAIIGLRTSERMGAFASLGTGLPRKEFAYSGHRPLDCWLRAIVNVGRPLSPMPIQMWGITAASIEPPRD